MAFTTMPIIALAQETQPNDPTLGNGSAYVQASPIVADENGQVIFPLTSRDVASSQELEQALSDGIDAIRLSTSFEIDRTFYVAKNTIVYSDQSVTLTRNANFVGDFFVVGQDSEDNLCDQTVIFSLGGYGENAQSKITVDGNSQNITATVVGSVVFVCPNAQADLYDNLTVTNCKKTGNERALNAIYELSNTKYVGGAVAIVSKNALLNVYGGEYINNSVNTSGESVYGGAFYNFAVTNVYGGLYQGNSAVRAGAFYNYRTLNVYNATISDNTSTTAGGAIYLPASTAAKLYLGGENPYAQSNVTFENNHASSVGGAIYSSGKIEANDTLFKGNVADEKGGAIYKTGSYIQTTTQNCVFENNTAVETAGAIFVNGHNTLEVEYDLSLLDTTFKSNTTEGTGGAIEVVNGATVRADRVAFTENLSASYGGAIRLTASTIDLINGEFTKNQASNGTISLAEASVLNGERLTFTENVTSSTGGGIHLSASTMEIDHAIFTGNQGTSGAGIYLTGTSTATLNRIDAQQNVASNNGGAIYATGSTLNVYNSSFTKNQAIAGSAIYSYTSSPTSLYGCQFEENSCYETNASNAGAVMLYTGEVESVIHSCSFTKNTSNGLGGALLISGKTQAKLYNLTGIENSAAKGGFLYETSAGTNVYISGLTLSGNTATSGGPIIWGNTANAKLYLNKTNCVDLDVSGELDSTYWASAIANKLTVYDSEETIPSYTDYSGELVNGNWNAYVVKNFAELESAINLNKPVIKVIDDIVFERTINVTNDTVIFSTSQCKFIRAQEFTGRLFVVGDLEGETQENGVHLSIGLSTANTDNLITIDGQNKQSQTAIEVLQNAQLSLYKGVSIINCSSENGAVLTVQNNATANLVGCEISNNASNLNGVILNYGRLNVEKAVISNNVAVNGGAIYNQGILNISDCTLQENYAEKGGAIYLAGGSVQINSTITNNSAIEGGAIYIATDSCELSISLAIFESNYAQLGGALYLNQGEFSLVGATFINNSAIDGGAIYSNQSTVQAIGLIANGDQTSNNGGFIYAIDSSLQLKENQIKNTGGYLGGAIYLENSSLNSVSDNFEGCFALEGGAIYGLQSKINVNQTYFTSNEADYNGGAIAVYLSEVYSLKSNFNQNLSYNDGGAIFGCQSAITVYETTFINNVSSVNGGAMAVINQSNAQVYTSIFDGNSSKKNAGAIYVSGVSTVAKIQLCQFINQQATRFGGVLYADNKANAQLYNVQTSNNNALRGGVVYLADELTQVAIIDLTVDQNIATDGPIAYGTKGAVLFVNKQKVKDLSTENLDSDYWNKALYGMMTVKAISDSAPEFMEEGNESAGDLEGAIEVSTADQLEQAILQGHKNIRVVSDFEIDRTFYITSEVTIFSTARYTLTRASDFGGDFFVVGEDSEGNNTVIIKADDVLTMGNPQSTTTGLLTIDGNKDNMTVDVYGSIFFVCNGGIVNLYENLSVINCHKVDNQRTLFERFSFSRANRVGGSVAIVDFGGLNVYGGVYQNNSIKVEDASTEEGRNSTNGGVFYNEGNITIYDGLFIDNEGARGGIVYNYAIMKIYGGSFISNHATISGGVYYSASRATSQLNAGYKSTSTILFKENTARVNGGAICSATLNGIVLYGNVVFEGNQALTGSGGAVYTSSTFTVKNVTFKDNVAASRGGAMFVSRASQTYVTRFVLLENCSFIGNSANIGGAISLYCSDASYESGSVVDVVNSEFIGNTAASGGAITAERKSILTIKDSTFTDNYSTGEAGVLYVISQATATIVNTTMANNKADSHGGAISVRSSTIDIKTSIFDKNSTSKNAGAIYISYSSDIDRNSKVTISDSTFNGNSTASSGGAIYATRRSIENDTKVLTLKSVDFKQNVAKENGGAVLLTAGVDVYMTDVSFVANSTTKSGDSLGGAIALASSILTVDGGLFTKNGSAQHAGGISVGENANVVLNNVVASRNTARNHGGFIYSVGTTTIHNSFINNNNANMGGGVYLYDGAITEIYNTEFNNNKSTENGGGLFVYTYGTPTVVNACTFNGNLSQGVGGGFYISGKSLASLYNLTGVNNEATTGGFIYETTSGTVVTLIGATVSQNHAQKGSIIWGNTFNAKLRIDKSKFVDLDYGNIDGDYWTVAISGSLTVEEITETAPTAPGFDSVVEKVQTSPVRTPVSVDDVFNLSQNSSDGFINATYDKFPILDNSSNFMSKEETYFENINGKTVKVDTFVYPNYSPADNMTVGEALLIFQAMQYKKQYPTENVEIDIASYRFSVQTAININRNSRYFGYARALPHQNYDEFGFVRVSYLLVSAAKMGVKVNVLAHRDAYPITNSKVLPSTVIEYFEYYLDEPCDPSYAEDRFVRDYLSFHYFDWTLSDGGKGGTDMMHTKLCAVSHYIDMNGEIHRDAVWTSSSNLDGITSSGYNANWKQQTANIISDHEYIYRTSVNYLRLMTGLDGQEEIIEFQNILNVETTKQIDLILAGKGDQIAKDEQLVYIGTEQDDVFELYFTPFAGDVLSWSEVYNPYSKYMRELYESEDYIVFTWNAAEYSGSFPLARQLENMLVDAFHKNKNPKNKIYANMESFDASTFDDLVVGKDIGFKSINKWEKGSVHNKDLQFSYVKNGQRYYVSLINSCNLHAGSMYFQSNFAIVIKETSCADDSVFSALAKYSTTGDLVEHTFTDTSRKEATPTEHGYIYNKCSICGQEEVVKTLHYAGDWIVERVATPTQNGIRYKLCTICNKVVESEETKYNGSMYNPETNSGSDFTNDTKLPTKIDQTPLTIQATVQYNGNGTRGGVIFGNYSSYKDQNAINLEIYTYGRVRLFYINNGVRSDVIFSTDIRSTEKVHIAVTVDGNLAKLYLNGQLTETIGVEQGLPIVDKEFFIGGDHRSDVASIFKGTIYSVAVFDDVRNAQEILSDMEYVSEKGEDVIYAKYFLGNEVTSFVGGEYNQGLKFTADQINGIEQLEKPISTIEAEVCVPTTHTDRAGVIVGNYNGSSSDTISIEVLAGGKIRLYYIANNVRYDYSFAKDIRSNARTHIAITVDGTTATLYVNGVMEETIQTAAVLPNVTEGFAVGGDYRANNAQFFKGTIYSLHLFSNVRTQSEIREDIVHVDNNDENVLYSAYYSADGAENAINGQTFNANTYGALPCDLDGTPQTFEAVIELSPSYTGRAGVIVSNNFKNSQIVSLEVYKNGKLRLYFRDNGQTVDCRFDTDVRSNKPIHLALSIEGTIAWLYINGELVETQELAIPLPVSTFGYSVGGDFRPGNDQYFKGTIYSVNLFDHARTQEQIINDMVFVDSSEALASAQFINAKPISGAKLHNDVKLVIVSNATPDCDGVAKYVCAKCGKVIGYYSIPYMSDGIINNNYENTDSSLGGNAYYKIEQAFDKAPVTYEVLLQLSPNITDRGGVILGNYNGASNKMNLEIYTNGAPRLWYKVNGVSYSYEFKADVRSQESVHLAFVVDGLSCSLYIDGVLSETVQLDCLVPYDGSNFYVATDARVNVQSFKGNIYSVSIFSDVRTQSEIKQDMIMITSDTDNVLFSKYFVASEIITAKGPLADKTAVFVGDGITAGINCQDAKYWEILKEGLELGETNAMGLENSCISGVANNGVDSLISRIDSIPQADLITIFMGTNDYTYDTPLGSINDTTDTSFYGALNQIITTLQAKYPNAKIVFATPTHRYGYGINSATGEQFTLDTLPNGAGYSLVDYVNAIKQACEKYSVACVDLYSDLDMDVSDEDTRLYYMEDGLHLTSAGHRLVADYLEHALIQIFSQSAE